jgi:hypothetical protein
MYLLKRTIWARVSEIGQNPACLTRNIHCFCALNCDAVPFQHHIDKLRPTAQRHASPTHVKMCATAQRHASPNHVKTLPKNSNTDRIFVATPDWVNRSAVCNSLENKAR